MRIGTRIFRDDIGHEPPLTPPEPPAPCCPLCGAETWELLRSRFGDVVGCPRCVERVEAEDESGALRFF